jgi:hypothetical protein
MENRVKGSYRYFVPGLKLKVQGYRLSALDSGLVFRVED